MQTDTPTSRPWLTDESRANLARTFGCDVSEVDMRLDARERMNKWLAERHEYEYPCGGDRR